MAFVIGFGAAGGLIPASSNKKSVVYPSEIVNGNKRVRVIISVGG